MAIIRPFKAYRPIKEHVKDIAALPYDVMSSKEARGMVKNNKYSFLHVDRAEVNLDESVGEYDRRGVIYTRKSTCYLYLPTNNGWKRAKRNSLLYIS